MGYIKYSALPPFRKNQWGKPVFIKGILPLNSKLNQWSVEYLNSVCPNQEVSVSHYDSNKSEMNFIQSFKNTELLTISKVFSQIQSGAFEKKAVEECPDTLYKNPNLLKDVEELDALFTSRSKEDQSTIWINGTNRVIDFHKDSKRALLILLQGEKIFRFVSPQYDEKMHQVTKQQIQALFKVLPSASGAQNYGIDTTWSDIKAFKADNSVEPKIMGYEIRIKQGDAITIPSNWWHATKSLKPSLSLNIEMGARDINWGSLQKIDQ